MLRDIIPDQKQGPAAASSFPQQEAPQASRWLNVQCPPAPEPAEVPALGKNKDGYQSTARGQPFLPSKRLRLEPSSGDLLFWPQARMMVLLMVALAEAGHKPSGSLFPARHSFKAPVSV